jgi:YHS domain-containing protein
MVLDPQCQSYITKSNAVAVAGRYFCSQECAQLYLGR